MTVPFPAFVTGPVACVGLFFIGAYHLSRFVIHRRWPSLIAAASPAFVFAQVLRECAAVPESGDSPVYLLCAALFAAIGCAVIYRHEEGRPYPWR